MFSVLFTSKQFAFVSDLMVKESSVLLLFQDQNIFTAVFPCQPFTSKRVLQHKMLSLDHIPNIFLCEHPEK